MSSKHESLAAEISCWSEWLRAVKKQQPGLYCVAGQTGSGKNTVLEVTRKFLVADGVRVIDSAGIVEIDGMLKGIVVVHGEVRDVAGMQRVVNLASVGAVVLCSMHARSVKDVIWRIRSPMLGASLEVVAPHLRTVMMQMLVPTIQGGRTCLNEIAVFETLSDVKLVLDTGPGKTLSDDADSKIAAGILARESAEEYGVLAATKGTMK